MKQYFLTPEIEVVEVIMRFPQARSVKAHYDYEISWKKGNGAWKTDTPNSFNCRAKSLGWIEKSKDDLQELGLI